MHIEIVFDGPPGPNAGRFVEVEDQAGRSICIGRWLKREDGFWALRIFSMHENAKPHTHVAGTTIGKHIDECAVCGQDLRCDVHRTS